MLEKEKWWMNKKNLHFSKRPISVLIKYLISVRLWDLKFQIWINSNVIYLSINSRQTPDGQGFWIFRLFFPWQQMISNTQNKNNFLLLKVRIFSPQYFIVICLDQQWRDKISLYHLQHIRRSKQHDFFHVQDLWL